MLFVSVARHSLRALPLRCDACPLTTHIHDPRAVPSRRLVKAANPARRVQVQGFGLNPIPYTLHLTR